MAATIDIDRMIEICFAAQFFVYGYMALFLYPYNDYDAVLHMRHTGSKPYFRGRRVLAVVYIFLGIAAGFGLCPASPSNGSAADGWASPLVPACLTLFFTAHAGMLLGLCDYAITERKNDLLRLLPLPVLCALYAAFPAMERSDCRASVRPSSGIHWLVHAAVLQSIRQSEPLLLGCRERNVRRRSSRLRLPARIHAVDRSPLHRPAHYHPAGTTGALPALRLDGLRDGDTLYRLPLLVFLLGIPAVSPVCPCLVLLYE